MTTQPFQKSLRGPAYPVLFQRLLSALGSPRRGRDAERVCSGSLPTCGLIGSPEPLPLRSLGPALGARGFFALRPLAAPALAERGVGEGAGRKGAPSGGAGREVQLPPPAPAARARGPGA